MLGFLDYPEWRKLITSPDELDKVLTENIKRAVSLIVMIGGDYDTSINSNFLKVWYGITGNKSLIEDINALAVQVSKGLLDIDGLGTELLKTLNKRRYGLVDLIMMNNYLKLALNINAYDLGLVILYENPESILIGVREPADIIPNKILSKELEVDLDAKCMVVKRVFSIFVSRQFDSSINVIDWSNPGLIPYTKFVNMRINDIEVSDPIFVSFVKFHVKISSKPVGDRLTLTLPKAMNVQPDANYCNAQSFVAMPQSMSFSDYLMVINQLKNYGYTVMKSPFTRVDELIEKCTS